MYAIRELAKETPTCLADVTLPGEPTNMGLGSAIAVGKRLVPSLDLS